MPALCRPDRPQRNRAVVKRSGNVTARLPSSVVCSPSMLMPPNIGADLLARHAAETGRQPVQRAGDLVHARRRLHHLLRADGVAGTLNPATVTRNWPSSRHWH